MTEFALLIGGFFKEIRHYETQPDDIPHKQVTWHPVVRDMGETSFTGLDENGNWLIRTALPTLAERRAARLAELADLRWQKEIGGMTFNGFPLATDAVSQTKYIGAVVGAQMDPTATLKWKMADGTFVTLDATAITGVAMAVRSHVQACFDREAELKAEIEAAADQAALDAIDITTGWPA